MNEEEEIVDEIVDLDQCSKKKSILLGAFLALLLGLVPYSYAFGMIHFLVAGFASAGHFARRYSITISIFQGVKLGSISALFGMLVFYVGLPLWILPSITEEQWAEVKEQVIQQAYEEGRPEMADLIESFAGPESVPFLLIGMFVILFFGSLILGSIGGLLGAVLFKKGPQAL